VLWGAVNLLSNIVDLSMTSALQRVVPAEDEETRACAVKLAFVSRRARHPRRADRLAGGAVALLLRRARRTARQPAHRRRLFAWALPLWTFVESRPPPPAPAAPSARNPPAHLLGADRAHPLRARLLLRAGAAASAWSPPTSARWR
jgi:hypothetical protein